MKRNIILISAILLVYIFCSGGIANAVPAGKDKTDDPGWKILNKTKQIDNVNIYDDTDKPLDPGNVKHYVMETAQLRLLLESVRLTEPVIIELRSSGHKLITNIGQFEPTIETKDGENRVSFDSIPAEVKVIVHRQDELQNQAFVDSLQDNRFWLTNPSYIYFKNAKKKLKAKPKIMFLYVSR